jgi:hypothetical protein
MPRTIGSKNKKPRTDKSTMSLVEQLDAWDKEEQHVAEQEPVDWQELCQKLQHALAKSFVDYEELEKKMKKAKILLKVKQCRIDDCERLMVEAVLCGDLDIKSEDLFLDEDDTV